jgi:hypothetical protein
MAARMAMMAITTNNSISVNAREWNFTASFRRRTVELRIAFI